MGMLKVTFFGGIRITHNDWHTEIIITRESQAILAYLLLHRHRIHSRDALAELLWGEHNQEKRAAR